MPRSGGLRRLAVHIEVNSADVCSVQPLVEGDVFVAYEDLGHQRRQDDDGRFDSQLQSKDMADAIEKTVLKRLSVLDKGLVLRSLLIALPAIATVLSLAGGLYTVYASSSHCSCTATRARPCATKSSVAWACAKHDITSDIICSFVPGFCSVFSRSTTASRGLRPTPTCPSGCLCCGLRHRASRRRGCPAVSCGTRRAAASG